VTTNTSTIRATALLIASLLLSATVTAQTVEDLLAAAGDEVLTVTEEQLEQLTQTNDPSLENLGEENLGEENLSEEEQEYVAWAKQVLDSLDPRSGEIELPAANATLNVPESFYFLGPEDSKTVLEEVWGNPPGNAVLGMLFPAGQTPLDQSTWGVTIEYLDDGYVSDEDAAEIDYDDMLKDLQADVRTESKARVEAGYEAISLVGWASPPYYEQSTNKLHWAQEYSFGEAEENTLNYNIRVLGRKGLLHMNFIAGMNQLDTIKDNVDTVLALAEFDQGSTYAEFDPSMDKVAAYGLGALVAGKVLAKTGLIAAAVIFLKKFGVFIVLGLGALVGRLFKKKSADDDSAAT